MSRSSSNGWDTNYRRIIESFYSSTTADTYSIEAATNITGPLGATMWTPLATVTNSFGAVQFNDALGTDRTQRFYRVLQDP